MNELISVVMSAYREREDHLIATIESILAQTYRNFEFIIALDDPDNEELKKLLKAYAIKDNRIKLIFNENNLGAAKSRNECIKIASGVYTAIMDGDDFSHPDRLEIEKNFLDDNPDIDAVFSARREIDSEGNILRDCVGGNVDGKQLPKILKYGDTLTNPTAMIRTEILKKAGGYRDIPAAEDYDLWLLLLSDGCNFTVLDEPLIDYRIRVDSLSRVNYAKTWVSTRYCQKLYKMRCKNGKDDFTDENYLKFASKSVLKNQKRRDAFNLRYAEYMRLVGKLKVEHKISAVFGLLWRFLQEPELIRVFYASVKVRSALKKAAIK